MTNSNPDRHEDLSSEEIAWLNIMEHDDLAKCLNGCMDWWKNAGPEACMLCLQLQGYFWLFAITDMSLSYVTWFAVVNFFDIFIFLTLMFPLVTVNRLLQDFGSDICLGYDIMCAFSMTLKQSSLGKKAMAFCLSGVVPAFHGHTHNHGCQVEWHPLYVEGVGLEDFEECECTFCH